ncbi:MAG: TerB family tellurite resistance protein [Polyangiales bacterium]
MITALLVAKVLVADGIMADTEKARLLQIMEELRLDVAESEQVLLLDGMDAAVEAARGLPAETRAALMDRLAEVALVDGRLSPHELREIQELAAALDV